MNGWHWGISTDCPLLDYVCVISFVSSVLPVRNVSSCTKWHSRPCVPLLQCWRVIGWWHCLSTMFPFVLLLALNWRLCATAAASVFVTVLLFFLLVMSWFLLLNSPLGKPCVDTLFSGFHLRRLIFVVFYRILGAGKKGSLRALKEELDSVKRWVKSRENHVSGISKAAWGLTRRRRVPMYIFFLEKWISNSQEISAADDIKNFDVYIDGLPTERAFGLHWRVKPDSWVQVWC